MPTKQTGFKIKATVKDLTVTETRLLSLEKGIIIKNVKECHQREKYKRQQVTVDRFKSEYPDAEVTTDYSYDRGNGSRNYSGGERYDIVRTKFVNGAQISYRVYADGSLSRVSFNLPGSKAEASFMKSLSQMNF